MKGGGEGVGQTFGATKCFVFFDHFDCVEQ